MRDFSLFEPLTIELINSELLSSSNVMCWDKNITSSLSTRDMCCWRWGRTAASHRVRLGSEGCRHAARPLANKPTAKAIKVLRSAYRSRGALEVLGWKIKCHEGGNGEGGASMSSSPPALLISPDRVEMLSTTALFSSLRCASVRLRQCLGPDIRTCCSARFNRLRIAGRDRNNIGGGPA